jgi:hypothetical protein
VIAHGRATDHVTASDPFPFVPHPDIAGIPDKARREAALHEARENHNRRVREHREAEERRRSIAAFNASH